MYVGPGAAIHKYFLYFEGNIGDVDVVREFVTEAKLMKSPPAEVTHDFKFYYSSRMMLNLRIWSNFHFDIVKFRVRVKVRGQS